MALWGVVFGMVCSGFQTGRAQQIWFAPTDNLPRGSKLFDQDFPRLFDEPPAWNAHIDVFQIAPYYAAKATPDDLKRVAEFLKKHHIALAASIQPTQVTNECAQGEGLTGPGVNLGIFRRLHEIGLDIRYVGMDEPLTYGHYYDRGGRACRFSIADVARRVAASVAEVRRYYPDAEIVGYEAPGIATVSEWQNGLAEWLDAYKAATGTPLHALSFDVNWRTAWLDWVRPGIEVLHRRGVKAGMILNSTGPGTSDKEAVATMQANVEAFEKSKLPVDLVVFASWLPYPSHSVPASDPQTLTSVLNRYLARHGRAD